jgi:26S proteasome regulatory subunit N5
MRWPGIEGLYGPTLRQSYVFRSALTKKADGKEVDDGERRWEELHKRVIEHVSLSQDQHQIVC